MQIHSSQIENDGKLLVAPQGTGRFLTMKAGLSGFGRQKCERENCEE